MVIMMKKSCYLNVYDFTIMTYGIRNSEGARGGRFLALDTV